MPLTDLEIRTAKAPEKPRKLFDGGGLFLRVDSKGSKLWRLSYRYAGNERTLSFGPYPEVSLKDARAKRDEAKALLAQGIDPSQQRKIVKLTRAVASATTFGGIADEFVSKQKREGRAPPTISKNESGIFSADAAKTRTLFAALMHAVRFGMNVSKWRSGGRTFWTR